MPEGLYTLASLVELIPLFFVAVGLKRQLLQAQGFAGPVRMNRPIGGGTWTAYCSQPLWLASQGGWRLFPVYGRLTGDVEESI